MRIRFRQARSPIPNLVMVVPQVDYQPDTLDDLELDKPCESTFRKCEYPATFMVWCDHHIQGCDYSGYRCHLHRNLLELESRRQVDAIKAGIKCVCAKCHSQVLGENLSDHFRWIKL